jgi:hypothetical protein
MNLPASRPAGYGNDEDRQIEYLLANVDAGTSVLGFVPVPEVGSPETNMQ